MLQLASKLKEFTISSSYQISDFVLDEEWNISKIVIKNPPIQDQLQLAQIEKINRRESHLDVTVQDVDKRPEENYFKHMLALRMLREDGEYIGDVIDLLIDDTTWKVKFIVVKQKGRNDSILITPDKVELIDSTEIKTKIERNELDTLPKFVSSKNLETRDKEVLYLNYGKVIY